MRRAEDQAGAVRCEASDTGSSRFLDLRRSSSGHDALSGDAAVKTQVLSELSVKTCVLQHLGLGRVKAVQTDINQVRQDGPDIAVGMEDDRQAGLAENSEQAG